MNIAEFHNIYPLGLETIFSRCVKRREKCAILANGETLRDFPADWPYITFGINRSWEVTSSLYHCIIDTKQLMWAVESDVVFEHLFVGQGDDEEAEAKKCAWLRDIRAKTVTLIRGQEKRYGLGFCVDLERDTFYIPSAPYMALQLARWMGFEEMHFWGLDLHGAKFWNAEWEIGQSAAQLQNRQFKFANRALKKLGVRVINHSAGTHCSAFEGV
jgi:hypothetical protein